MCPKRTILLVLFLLLFPFTLTGLAQEVAQVPKNTAELATALLTAKTEAEQTALLAVGQSFVTVELCRELMARGETRLRQRQSDPALAAFQLTLTVARRLNNQSWQAQALSKKGAAFHLAGQNQVAIELQQQSLTLFRALGDPLGEAEALRNLGMIQRGLGNYPLSLEHYQQALVLAERMGDNLQLARTFNSLSILSRYMGQNEQSLEYAKQALARFETAGDKFWIASMQLSLGNTYADLGEGEAALAAYQKGLRLSEEQQDAPRISSFLTQLGLLYHKQGNYGAAQTAYERSLALDRQANDAVGLTNLLVNLGSLHFLQGNYAKALEYEFEALERYRKRGEKPGIASLLNNIGEVFFEQGRNAEAREYLQQALQLSQEINRADIQAMVIQKLGHLHRFAGRHAEALAAYKQAVELNEGRQEWPSLAVAYGNLADFYSYAGQHRDAVVAAERALELAAKLGSAEIEWQMRTVIGRAQRASNQPEQARRAFDEAIKVVERMRDNASEADANKSHFLGNKLAAYQEQISLAVAQRQFATALQYAERAKARALFDVLQQGRADWNKALTEAERADEQQLKQAMNKLNAQLMQARGKARPDDAQIADLTAQLQKARLAYEEFQARLFSAHSELKLQRGQAPLFQMADAAALVPDARTALLEFALTPTQLYLFVVTRVPELKLEVFELPLTHAQLDTQVEELRRLLATRNLDFRAAALRLYDGLLKPAQAVLQGKTQLVIVPEERLWELPFQALHDGKQYMLERVAISYAPSLTVLGAMQKLRQPRTNAAPALLAFGNPSARTEGPSKQVAQSVLRSPGLAPLPQSETEVNALARLYDARHSRVYLGAEAREDRFKAEAGKYDVLHIAAHGLLNDTKPLYSQIVLATDGTSEGTEDGLLEAWELLKLNLHPDLVVLSACETARGNVVAGEGVIGLSWALFVAGAPTVVVSQWKVDADATTPLMVEFHRQLRQRSASTKAEALRQAALKLLRGAYRHPFYWAGFVAVGAAN
jgi:CHAT domain-containing protein/tetratricopeptide (TPR) repeat protein